MAPQGRAAERLLRLVPKEYTERLLATRGQVSKERRTVTILFSHVKGSTAMAEKLDPEEWTELMKGGFDVLIEPVYRYEGTLARLVGDAVLAFFGAPIAHEDDPERAMHAALEIIAGANAGFVYYVPEMQHREPRGRQVLSKPRDCAGANLSPMRDRAATACTALRLLWHRAPCARGLWRGTGPRPDCGRARRQLLKEYAERPP